VSDKELVSATITALAAIDAELGLPEDGCNSTARTLTAIRLLHSVHRDDVAEIERLHEQMERGTAALRTAFGPELWQLGHPAYVVVHLREEIEKVTRLWKAATVERDALLARVEAAEKNAGRLRRGLDFYAQQSHFLFDDGWDTVSGEPQNFWCDEYGATVEDGTIAKLVLAGWDMPADDDGDMIPPTDAAMEGGK